MIYRISINTEPEIINGNKMWFWCVLGQNDEGVEFNCGHGWSSGVLTACECAREWWERCLKEKEEE